MADIKQMGEWIRDGKHVVRHSWRHTTLGLRKDGMDHAERLWLFYTEECKTAPMEYVPYLSDLLAADWEIAE